MVKHMKKKEAVNGCMKQDKGPWKVHRTTKDGRVVTRFRYPSEQERERNREREMKRRNVSRNIFEGLRAFGNYKLPEKAHTIDLLRAVCEEAGWEVDQDGNVIKKKVETSDSRRVLEMMGQKEHDMISCNLSLSLTLATASYY